MRDAPELERIERWMLAVVTDPGGAESGIASTGEQATDRIHATPELSAERRLEIYAHGYFARLIDVLAADFPTVRHVLGEEGFAKAAREYLTRHPSRSYTLNRLGRHFAGFLRDSFEHEHARFLADVARIEWAMEEVFDAAWVEPLAADAVSQIPPEQFAAKHLEVIPAFRILELDHPANAFLQARLEERHMDIPGPAPETVVVYRARNYRAYRHTLEPAQVRILESLVRGATLGDALQSCAEAGDIDLESVIARLEGWFREWSGDGLFCRIR